jgi:hypothetical protein
MMSLPADPASQARRPPRYTTEDEHLLHRTPENDQEAMKLVARALDAVEKRRRASLKSRSDSDRSQVDGNKNEEEWQDGDDSLPFAFGDVPLVRLPLRSMYDGTGTWPKGKLPPGSVQHSWSNIGFPNDASLVLKDFEADTHIDATEPSVIELSQDIKSIREKLARDVADGGLVERHVAHNRAIENFTLHGRTVCKIKIEDADISARGYSNCHISKDTEIKISQALGNQPPLDIEQWVAAQLLLCRGGQIGGRTQDFWRKARDLAQQQLYMKPTLQDEVRQQMQKSSDAALAKMLALVKRGILKKAFNPYYQAQRDEYAVTHGVFHQVVAEIVIVLDQADKVIVFQCSDAFRKLLTKGIEKEVAKSLETFSTLQPLPVPDMTRHGLHWIEWLAKDHPEFDYRNPANNPRLAKSGVYHFGAHCDVGDPNGKKTPGVTKDSGSRHSHKGHILQQMSRLRYSAFGACTELTKFFFSILDPDLLNDYLRVSNEVHKLGFTPFETRRGDDDPFVLRAALVNLMTNEHRDSSDWQHGLAGLVPVGDFEGGNLLLRELGLDIESKPGCVQLFRGRELRHSITKWKGRRFVVVSTTHEAVRRWALRQQGREVDDSISTADTCGNIEQEDVLPEDQRILSERERIPERYIGFGSDEGSDEDSDSI